MRILENGKDPKGPASSGVCRPWASRLPARNRTLLAVTLCLAPQISVVTLNVDWP